MSTSDQLSRLNSVLADRYRAERELGEGGMATVYLAKDLRHDRAVALKVLKPELAAVVGHERFLAEIATTANLQHPHVLPLFDSGEADGLLFYVMPYVEGESLRQRLDREHQLPVDDAVRIATEMAEALDHTHRHGVVHRDIKPGNVLLIDGKAVISDFGIALAVGAAGGGRLTETGMSLGTPHYMSPEQATGDGSVGAASDIYAVGCVLYEMLTGEPPYTGGTPQAVLGRIITSEVPSAKAERATVPANVDAAIRKALEKIPADRFGRARDLARALADGSFRHRDEEALPRPRGSSRLVAGLGALCVALAGVLLWSSGQGDRPRPSERFAVPFEPGTEPHGGGGEWWALPDGTGLVYTMTSYGPFQLRSFTDLHSAPIPGVDGGNLAFEAISPDGTQVVFRSRGGQIRVVSLAGGPGRTLMQGRYAGWGDDGYVYVSTDEGLDRVPAEGGEPEPVTRLAEGEVIHRFSDAVPGGILIEVNRGASRSVELVDLSSSERAVLVSDGRAGRWLRGGYLLYLVDNTLTADAFDVEARRVAGRPVSLLTGVSTFSIVANGRLVYREAGGGPDPLELVWMSRSGQAEPVSEQWFAMDGVNVGWRLSADDREVAFARWVEGNWDIWIMETASGQLRRLTDHPAREMVPRWSPDGSQVGFVSWRTDSVTGPFGFWAVPRDGGQAPTLLFGHQPVAAGVWSPDGGWLVVRTTTGPQGPSVSARDILGSRPGVDSVPLPLAASPDAEEAEPEISPDGQWLAYTSNTTGRQEVFVQPFPEANGTRWQISLDGGILPLWSHQGDELFFVRPDTRELVSVLYDGASSAFRIVSREVLFVVPPDFHLRASSEAYDLSSDGQRFLMARTPADLPRSAPPRIFVIDNWTQEVERRLSR